ncbi:MAG: hypothetical protein LBU38_03980 [Propionibacteriaceae bacterium]|nr:hypothetical protein [Propionibacteriaceae bacterium]
MPDTPQIVAGFDIHADTRHVAAVSMAGVKIADKRVPATPTGYRQARQFIATYPDALRARWKRTDEPTTDRHSAPERHRQRGRRPPGSPAMPRPTLDTPACGGRRVESRPTASARNWGAYFLGELFIDII